MNITIFMFQAFQFLELRGFNSLPKRLMEAERCQAGIYPCLHP